MLHIMNSNQFKRFLTKQGCTFASGKGGHLIVRRGSLKSVIPMHGGSKELGKGLVHAILKQLDIKERP